MITRQVTIWMGAALAIGLAAMLVLTPLGAAVAVPAAPPEAVAQQGEEYFVVSDFEGFFYAAEYPGEPPLVKVGDRVQPQTVVAYIQGMKKIPVTADVRGMVVEVIANDLEVISAGQPLFRIVLDP